MEIPIVAEARGVTRKKATWDEFHSIYLRNSKANTQSDLNIKAIQKLAMVVGNDLSDNPNNHITHSVGIIYFHRVCGSHISHFPLTQYLITMLCLPSLFVRFSRL